MNTLEILGIAFVCQISVVMSIVSIFILKLLLDTFKKKQQYLSLLHLDAKLKKDRDKYIALLNKLQYLPIKQQVEIILSIVPKENRIPENQYEEYLREWANMPLDERLKFVAIPHIEKQLNALRIDMSMAHEAKHDAETEQEFSDKFWEELDAIPIEIIVNILKEKYPQAIVNVDGPKHVLITYSPDFFNVIWKQTEKERKVKILNRQLSNEDFIAYVQTIDDYIKSTMDLIKN